MFQFPLTGYFLKLAQAIGSAKMPKISRSMGITSQMPAQG